MKNIDFSNCEYFKIGDLVKLSVSAKNWKFGNTTRPQYIVDGLKFDTEYIVTETTPIMSVSGGDQQFLSVDGAEYSTYPCWSFTKSSK